MPFILALIVISRPVKLLITGLLLLASASSVFAAADSGSIVNGRNILVVCSKDCNRSREMIDGFSASLKNLDEDFNFRELGLTEGDAANGRFDIGVFTDAGLPGLIFAVDIAAARLVSTVSKAIPIIVGKVRSAEDLKAIPHTTGLVVQHPPETQLKWLKRVMPTARRVGVLYSTEENREEIEAAQVAAQKLNLELVAVRARTPKDLPLALKDVLNRVDVLLGIPDSVILSRQTAKAILLASFRKRIPFVGLSASWVKAGALYSLDSAAEDLGEQSAQIGVRLLSSVNAEVIGVQHPTKIGLIINAKTAEHLNLKLPNGLIGEAQQVFN
ncbi:MAG: hypothetical protein KUG71_04770 [Porticoccaceae bacterium]|nr:hypothetical protein [Porticoccaceae bacterium]